MFKTILLTFIVALISAKIAQRLKLPAPFMTGSMIGVALYSVFVHDLFMPSYFKTFAQIVSGAYIGQQISKRDLQTFPKMAKPILFLLLLFTINTFAMGFLFFKLFDFDLITSLLSCLPGGIMDVSLISIDMGAKSEIVATMQLIRLVGMLLILPYWIEFLIKKLNKNQDPPVEVAEPKLEKTLNHGTNSALANNLLILVVAAIGGLIGVFLQIPVGALSLSLVFSIGIKLLKNTAPLSKHIRFFAQLIAGSIIGSTITRDSILNMGSLILPAIILLSSYLVINVIFGVTISRRKLLDFRSALFASSPAGATDISLIAGDLGGDMTKIALVQISRTLYTVIFLPQFIRIVVAFVS
ncbi:AbrB family transcriptional regulator [Enterococcus sp. LJL90]